MRSINVAKYYQSKKQFCVEMLKYEVTKGMKRKERRRK